MTSPTFSPPSSPRRVLAVASGGGHWVQLRRIAPAFEGHDVTWVTVQPAYRHEVAEARFHVVRDATRWDRWGMVVLAVQLAAILLRRRPHVIVSTGALPGFLAIRMGKLLRARTVWLDSIANAETLSMSGAKIVGHADLVLTQWPELARPDGPVYAGSVL